jgi:AbrB family looped-hinge helix DNA binding protein
MRITSKGQVTIPVHIREQAGLLPDTEVEFAYDGEDGVRLFRSRKKTKKPSRGKRLVEHLKARGGDVPLSTDEIMALTRGDKQ